MEGCAADEVLLQNCLHNTKAAPYLYKSCHFEGGTCHGGNWLACDGCSHSCLVVQPTNPLLQILLKLKYIY